MMFRVRETGVSLWNFFSFFFSTERSKAVLLLQFIVFHRWFHTRTFVAHLSREGCVS